MDMPPLFSHNGVVGQTTSHLVASDHLSLNSLLSQSQSVYGHKGVSQNQSLGGPSHISPSAASTTQGGGITSHSTQHTRSRKQITIVNAIQSSLSSSIRDRKRTREDTPSDSEEEQNEDKAKNLTKKKSLSAPNIISPSGKSPKGKRARVQNQQEPTQDKIMATSNQVQPGKKTVAFADSSSDKSLQTRTEEPITSENNAEKPPKMVLPRMSDLVQNSTHLLKRPSEDDSQKPLLSNPEAISQDRETNKKRVKAMIADVFEESESEEENDKNKENELKATAAISTILKTSTASTALTGTTFKLDNSSHQQSIPSKSIAHSTEKSVAAESKTNTSKKEEKLQAEGLSSKKVEHAVSGHNVALTDKFVLSGSKLPEVPSTLELISPTTPATSSVASSTAAPAVLAEGTSSILTSTNSENKTASSTLSGFTFGVTSPKSEASPQVAVAPATAVAPLSNTTSTNASTFTFSSKKSDNVSTTASSLSSKSVLSALTSPSFNSTFPISTSDSGLSTDLTKKIASVTTTATTSSSSGGFQFNLGKPGVTSPNATLPSYNSASSTLSTAPKPVSAVPPSAGFNFSAPSTAGFSFGLGNQNNVTATTTNASISTIVAPPSVTAASAVATPSVTSNLFSFGAKTTPDVTTKAPSAASSFTFGKTEDKSQAVVVTTTNTPIFSFGAASSTPSTQSSNVTGKPYRIYLK